MKSKNKRAFVALASVMAIALVIALLRPEPLYKIDKNLQNYLSSNDNLPPEKIFDAVYILGGNQESLKAKYKTAASIYAKRRCKKIAILSRPGITEYNNFLGRNMTNDEWSLMILEGLGVSEKDIQTFEIQPGFFGTYNETKWVSKIAKKNSWKNLLLITSPHHTNRVKKCFAHLIGETEIQFLVKSSQYTVGFFELLSELFKLKFYQIFLLN